MPLRAALPIIRKPSGGDYSSFYREGESIVRFVRQPKLAAGADGRSTGLALTIENPGADIEIPQRLYAMFPGVLRFGRITNSDGQTIDALALRFDSPTNLDLTNGNSALGAGPWETMNWLYRLNTSCLQLSAIVYENVDVDKVNEALLSLVGDKWDEYLAFLTNPSSPASAVLRSVSAGPAVTIRNLRAIIRRSQEEAQAQLREVINQFTVNPEFIFLPDARQRVRFVELPVDAGTWIGNMAAHATIKFVAHSNVPPLNPLYFFRLMLKWRDYRFNDRLLLEFVENYESGNLLTSDAPTTSAVHPLLWRLRFSGEAHENYLGGLSEPIGESVEERHLWQLFVPPAYSLPTVATHRDAAGRSDPGIQALVNYGRPHGVPSGAPIEWRVDDYGFLLSRTKADVLQHDRHPWEEESYFTFVRASSELVAEVISDWGAFLEAASTEFLQPVEFIIGIICKESNNVPTITAFEPGGVPETVTPGSGGRYYTLTHVHCLPFVSSIDRTTLDWSSVPAFKRGIRDMLTAGVTAFDYSGADYDYTLLNRNDKALAANNVNAALLKGEQVKAIVRKISSGTLSDEDRIAFAQIVNDFAAGWVSLRLNAGVPLVLNGGDVVAPAKDKFYTWDALKSDLRGYNGQEQIVVRDLPRRISPGLMQTLLILVRTRARSHRAALSRVVNVGRAPDDPLVVDCEDFATIFDALRGHPQLSIATGSADLRAKGTRLGPEKRYDPLILRAVYGAGSYKDSDVAEEDAEYGLAGGRHIDTGARGKTWASYYNAAVAYLNDNIQPWEGVFRLSTVTVPNQDVDS